MKNKLLFIAISVFVLFDLSLLIYYFVLDKRQTPAIQVTKQQLNEFLPNVEIKDFSFDEKLFKNERVLKGQLTLYNRENVSISGVALVIELQKIITKENSDSITELIDKKIIDREFSLKPLDNKKVTFNYTFSPHIDTGNYYVMVNALSQTGLTITGKLKLVEKVNGDNNFLEIDWRAKKFVNKGGLRNALEGVGYESKTTPQIILKVKNPHIFPIVATPQFTIYPRTDGPDVKPIKQYTETSEIFTPQSERELTFSLPAYEEAESYLAHLVFLNKNSEHVSGLAEFRWVIEGEGGKILSLKFDKGTSFLGKTKTMLIANVIGPPDATFVEDAIFQVKVFSPKQNKQLLTNTSKKLTINAQASKIAFPVEFDSFFNSYDDLLVQSTLLSKNQKDVFDNVQKKIPLEIESNNKPLIYVGVVFILIFLVIITLFRVKKKKNYYITSMWISIFLSGVVFVFLTNIAHLAVFAQTRSVETKSGCAKDMTNPRCTSPNLVDPSVIFSVELKSAQDIYVGSPVTVETRAEVTVCGNGYGIYDSNISYQNGLVNNTGKTQTEKSAIHNGIASFPGIETISANQNVDIITLNNCWPGCSYSSSLTVGPVNIQQQYYVCNNPTSYKCIDAGYYLDKYKCSDANNKKTCYTAAESLTCNTACQDLAYQNLLTPEPPKDPSVTPPPPPDYKKCDFPTQTCRTYPGVVGTEPSTCTDDPDCVFQLGGYYNICQQGRCSIGGARKTTGNETNECWTDPECQNSNNFVGSECALLGDLFACVSTSNIDPSDPYKCTPIGGYCTPSWSDWTAPPGYVLCGQVKMEKTCNCSGPCCNYAASIADYCPNEGYGTGTCNSKVSDDFCLSTPPEAIPSVQLVTQPDGGAKVQTRDVLVTWKFADNGSGCNKSWGFMGDTSDPLCRPINQNQFQINFYDSSKTFIRTFIPSSINDRSYTTNQSFLTKNGGYYVEVCAHNGFGKTCSNQFYFEKYAIPNAIVEGNLKEHHNNPSTCWWNGQTNKWGIDTRIALDIITDPPTTILGLSTSCTYTTYQPDPVNNPTLWLKNSYTCTTKFDNEKYDFTPAQLVQTFKIDDVAMKKILSNTQYKNNYYCVSQGSCPGNFNTNTDDSCTSSGNKTLPFVSATFDRNNPNFAENPQHPNKVTTFGSGSTITIIRNGQGQYTQNLDLLFDVRGGTSPNASGYYKLKNASYLDRDGIISYFPGFILPYDTKDDTGGSYFVTEEGGSGIERVGTVLSYGTVELGAYTPPDNNGDMRPDINDPVTSPISPKKWASDLYTKAGTTFNSPSTFRDYVLARKGSEQLPLSGNNHIGSLASDKIYYHEGNLTFDQNDVGQFEGKNIVVIMKGNLTIEPQGTKRFPPSGTNGNNSTIIVADTITLGNDVDEIRGVFIANTLNLTKSGTSSTPLKVKGNIITVNPIDTADLKRKRESEPEKPSLFVIFDPSHYINAKMLNLFSVSTYKWSELVP